VQAEGYRRLVTSYDVELEQGKAIKERFGLQTLQYRRGLRGKFLDKGIGK
jgi:hypothetical protein